MKRYSLRDAIFSSKYLLYAIFRMRFFLLISITSLAVEIIELFLVKDSFSGPLIAQIVFMRLAMGLCLGAWWGGLEILREFVRGRYSFSDRQAINLAISNWLMLSLVVAATVAVITVNCFINQHLQFSPKEQLIFRLYLLGFVIVLLFEFWLDAYRSGAFAIRRIYRPFLFVITPGLVALLVLFLLWKFLGPLGLPFAFIAGKLINGLVRGYFVKKTYQGLRLNPISLPTLKKFWDFLLKLSKFNILAASLAGISLNIEILLFFIFFAQMKAYHDFILYLFILRLIYHAYSHWGLMFFYYDFKKMCEEAYPPFYKQFLNMLLRASFVISLIFYLMTLPVTYAFYPHHLTAFLLITFVFFMFISIFSYMEIHAFSQNRYADLIASSILGIIIFLTGNHFYHSLLGISISLLVSLIAIVLFLIKGHFPKMSTINSVKKQSVYTLIYNLVDDKSGFRIIRLKTDYRSGRKALNRFLSQVALLIDQRGWICPLRTNEFLLIETKKHAALNVSSLPTIEPDLIKSSSVTECPNRIACLNLIHGEFEKELSGNPFYTRIKPGSSVDKQIMQLFKESFPEDLSFDLARSNPLFNYPDKQKIYAAIEASYLIPLAIIRELPYAGVLFFNSVHWLFLIKKEGKKFTKIFNWTKFIHFLNIDGFKKAGYKI